MGTTKVSGQPSTILREPGIYAPFPLLVRHSDGSLVVGITTNTFRDHYNDSGEWVVLQSQDGGDTWHRTTDPTIPLTWPGSTPRECYDRVATIAPDGTYVAAGLCGWEQRPSAQRPELLEQGFTVAKHPSGREDIVLVGSHRFFVQRSRDRGATWARQEWTLPGGGHHSGFPYWISLADGTLLAPMWSDRDGRRRNGVLRSTDHGATWRLHPCTTDLAGTAGGETALVEVAPGRVLAHIRQSPPGYVLESWSDDGGRTWSHPLRTSIWGYPPHLLKLADGRLLCTYGHRRPPLGVQAVLSEDGGRTWDVAHRLVLRDDGETTDLGYPMSVQLADGSIFTAYYITLGGVTQSPGLRWELP